MKNSPILALSVTGLLLLCSLVVVDGQDRTAWSPKAELQYVLELYQKISGFELIQSSQVNEMNPMITISAEFPAPKDESLRTIEQAVLEQAGIVLTQLDSDRVSVTYNDKLPIATATN